MSTKQRLSATVDANLLRAAERAVRQGSAPNVSAWVNEAMRRQRDHDDRMKALDAFIATFESEHGPITEDDVRAATRRTRARAVVVRGGETPARRGPRRDA